MPGSENSTATTAVILLVEFLLPGMEEEIKPHIIYTTEEARGFLKVSDSTIKRLLKRGVIKAHKVGGQYRIWGDEILRLVSPEVEDGVYKIYRQLKTKAKKTIEKW